MIFKDQLNREIYLKESPKRIISLVPSQTELLVDLGLVDNILGVTKFCIHPKHIKKSKTIVGGTKQVHFEKVKNLQPDIILCNKEENTKEMIDELEKIAPVHISDIYSLEDNFEIIRMYGDLFNATEKAFDIIGKIKEERQLFINRLRTECKIKVAYFIWKDPWMVAASNTFIDTMIYEAGFINAFKNETRYPEIELNNSVLNDVDIIFLSSEPFPFKALHIEALKNRFLDKPIKIVDGELFSWYGSRLQHSYDYFLTLHQKN